LKFDNARNAGRWEPTYFTKLLTPAELRSRSFVSKQLPAGYGGVLVGVDRPPNPRAMLLPWIGVSAPVTAVLNFSKPAQSSQPARATLTLYDPARQSTARIAGKDRTLAADLRAPFGFYRPPAFLGMLGFRKFLFAECSDALSFRCKWNRCATSLISIRETAPPSPTPRPALRARRAFHLALEGARFRLDPRARRKLPKGGRKI